MCIPYTDALSDVCTMSLQVILQLDPNLFSVAIQYFDSLSWERKQLKKSEG
jgi:hypothetical protein